MKQVLIMLIRLYQRIYPAWGATPLFLGNFSGCRSWPTCSAYAISTINARGAIIGSFLALKRTLRCRPSMGRLFS